VYSWRFADRGKNKDWYREVLTNKAICHCIPGRKPRNKIIGHEKRFYKPKKRLKRMLGMLRDWIPVEIRYNCHPQVFLSAIAFASTFMFYLLTLNLIK
jgi:hypothetical protein